MLFSLVHFFFWILLVRAYGTIDCVTVCNNNDGCNSMLDLDCISRSFDDFCSERFEIRFFSEVSMK